MMRQKLRNTVTTISIGAVLLLAVGSQAQQSSSLRSTERAKYFTEMELAAALAGSRVSSTRHTARLLDGTPHNVTLDRLDGPNTATIHRYAEMYVIRAGSGVLITGGSLLNAKPLDAETTSGTGIIDGERRTVAAGDVVYIPAGTAHVYETLNPSITYLLVRFSVDSPKK